MFLEKLYEYKDGSIQTGLPLRKCKYCGKDYIKLQNKTLYCSQDCKNKANQDNKAKYQRKRRKLIKDGELISNETQKLGTTYFPEYTNDWQKEREMIKKAKKHAGII